MGFISGHGPNGRLRVMMVDDEPIILESFRDCLDEYPIETFTDPREALAALRGSFYDIVVSDYRMPGISGLDLLIEAKRSASYDTGILLTAFADKQVLLDFVNRDLVSTIVEKPLDLPRFKAILDETIADRIKRKESAEKLDAIRCWYEEQDSLESWKESPIVGFDGDLGHVCKDLVSIAAAGENVLVTGETGTGKELIARTIHRLSPNRLGPFVSINCGALPDTLVESELFGYVKGAFTGALADKPGKIELAHGGTLFLDEVAELRPDLQVKLLRVVEEKEVERLGSTKGRKIDFRLIAATNRDIAEAIRNGVFREDLYYRVSTIPVHLPPLRERGRDFERLVERLLRRYAEEMGRKPVLLSPDALGLLRKYRWPGNIRELENVLKRAVILLDHGVKEIDADVFSYLTDRKPESTCSFDAALTRMSTEMISGRITFKQLERRILTGILDRFSGNIKAAVQATGISKDRFYRGRI